MRGYRVKNCFKKMTAAVLTAAMLLSSGCAKNGASSEATVSDDTSSVVEDTAENLNAKVYIEGNKFMVDGKELWINGVNTPWHRWNDFIGNMDYDFWDSTFAQLASDGINATRIWLNCDGGGTVQFKQGEDGNVVVKGINSNHWDDVAKLFEIAEKHHVYVMATLLSFDHFKSSGTAGENFRGMITNKEGCDSFAEKYVKEFCERFGEEKYLFSIDIMNEPDWVHENTECGQIGWDDLSYFFGKCASVIHDTCSTPVTVGMGIIKYNSAKYEGDKIADDYLRELTGIDNATVDFYSTHYYMWEKPYFGFPFNVTPEEFGIDTDKPCLIGETSNDDEKESGMTLYEKYRSAYENGWQGVMVWMQTQEDMSWYRYDLTEAAAYEMYSLIPDKVDPLGALSVTANVTSE